MTANARRSKARGRRFPVVPVAVAAAVLIAAVIAFIATSGDDGEGSSGRGAADVAETREVTVQGSPLPAFPDSGADTALGVPAPELSGKTFYGNAVGINKDGRPKVVVFLAHWCPHCQREVPELVKWMGANGAPKDVDLYAVSTSVNEQAPNYPPSKWLTRERFDVVTLADDQNGTAAKAFGLSSFPYFVALDASGAVVGRTAGAISMAEFEQLLARAAGTPS